MREYARIAPTFWTRGSGKKLRGDPDAQVVAFYLFTGPNATMIGLYHLVLPTMAHEIGLPVERARAALARVCAVGIAMYDEEEELVFLPEGAKYQIGCALSGNDPRKKGVVNALEPFGGHPFVGAFLQKYARAFSLTITTKSEAPSKQVGSTLEAPPGLLRSQDQDQAQDQAQKKARVGFENPPPSGAGPSSGSADDSEPLAFGAADAPPGDLAPVDAAEEAPVPGPAPPPESPIASRDGPEAVFGYEPPATGQPEPPACPPADEPATPTQAAPAPAGPAQASFAPSDVGQAALLLTLAPIAARFDPVEAIFAEYVAAWRRVVRGRRPPKLDDKRRRLTLARLKDFPEEDLKSAARGVFASEWNVENKQTDYDLVMRDVKHVEKFMQCDEEARAKTTAAQKRVPDWLSESARPSPRVVAALREQPPDLGHASDLYAILDGLGVVVEDE